VYAGLAPLVYETTSLTTAMLNSKNKNLMYFMV
jgi:hypothetical protein